MQFSLRTLLIVVLAYAVYLAVYARQPLPVGFHAWMLAMWTAVMALLSFAESAGRKGATFGALVALLLSTVPLLVATGTGEFMPYSCLFLFALAHAVLFGGAIGCLVGEQNWLAFTALTLVGTSLYFSSRAFVFVPG